MVIHRNTGKNYLYSNAKENVYEKLAQSFNHRLLIYADLL